MLIQKKQALENLEPAQTTKKINKTNEKLQTRSNNTYYTAVLAVCFKNL